MVKTIFTSVAVQKGKISSFSLEMDAIIAKLGLNSTKAYSGHHFSWESHVLCFKNMLYSVMTLVEQCPILAIFIPQSELNSLNMNVTG